MGKKRVWRRVGMGLLIVAVLIAVCLGVLLGMTKHIKVAIDYGDGVKEYDISRSLMADINNKVMYHGSMLEEYRAYLSKDSDYNITDMANGFDTIVSDMCANEHKGVRSRIDFVNSKEKLFEYYVGENGKVLNSNAYDIVLTSIDNDSAANNLYEIDRAKSLDELKNETTLLSSYTTEYATSSASRRKNIAIASGYLNGSIIQPNMQLSFNEIVGERTAERGFEEAKVIVNGEYVKGYGGGVCQVSTTLYNAWVLAGGGVIYATQHSLPPHYVDLSRDAMVSSYNDMILSNNGKTPIYVRSFVGNDDITFEIYGMKSDVRYEIESKLVDTLPIGTKYIGDINEGEEYTEQIVSYGVPGYESKAYLVSYDTNGIEIGRRLLREDKYLSQPKIIERMSKI